MTTQQTQNRRIGSGHMACLLAAPAVALVARTRLTPYWDDPAKYLAEVAAGPSRSDLGASLVVLSALLFIGAALALAGLVRDRTPRLAATAAVMTVVGCIGMVTVSTSALVAGQMARIGDTPTMVELWDQVWNDPKMWTIWLVHVGAVGFILFAVLLHRTRVVPRVTAVLVGLGGAATMTTSAGPVRPVLIAAATVALVGLSGVVVAVGRDGTRVQTRLPSHRRKSVAA